MREAERALKNGALGVQIYTNIAGKPLDDPAFEPFFAAMNRLNKPIWMHPARAANFPDYLTEKKSKYEIWWTFGWSYETAAAMARLVFSKITGQISEPEDHHPPFRRHRADAGRPHRPGLGPARRAHLGRRPQRHPQAAEEASARLFQALILCGHRGVRRRCRRPHAGLAFYDPDKIVFASDCPFDPEKGTMYTRETLRIIEGIDMPKADKEKIWHGNLEAITGVKFKS